MADAADVPAETKTGEVQQEVKVDEQSNEILPEQTIQQEESIQQEEPVQEESADVKPENVTKQEEGSVGDVKNESEIRDEAAGEVKTEGDSEATHEKSTERKPRAPKPNKSKFDPTVLPDSDDPEEIRKQVEFYFSQSNLSSDRFLFGLVGGKENKPVPLNLIMSFKRMKRFPSKEAVLGALKESTELELGGDAGDETVKRKVALEITELIPRNQRYGVNGGGNWQKSIDFDPNQDQAITRSIYAKGFGDENATTQIDIEKFFEPYGPINAVRLRRTDHKTFKRSVFVEFANDELAQKFIALEEKPTWDGKELLWMTKLAYVEGKIQDIKDGKVQAKSKPDRNQRGNNQNGGQHKHHGGRGGRGRGGQRGGRGGRGRGGHDRRGDRDNKREAKKEDNGIPKLKSSSEPTATPAHEGAGKRKATDEGTHEVKKPKVETTA